MDEEDVVWFSQDRLGLCLYNLKDDELTYANLSGKIQEINLMIKSYRRMAVWISDRNRPHIMRLVRRGNTLVTDYELMLNSIQKNCGSVTQLLEDAAANLWVMTEHNLFIVPSNHKPILCKDLRQINVSHLSIDQTGNVWAISTSNRVLRLQLDDELHVQQQSTPFSFTPEESAQFSCIDYEGCLWIASSSGLIFKSDKGKDKFKLVSFDGALDDCTILKMLIDKQYLWIVTNKKILKYNLRTQSFLDYATTDPNIRVHLFRGQAACSDSARGIYAGGHNGFIHIDGSEDAPLYNTEIIPEVTDIKANNQSIFFFFERESAKEKRPLKKREPAKNTIKMKQACRMLVEHELSISEIAYALGFTNPKYFTKCFKEEFGTTPTEYQSTPRPLKEEGEFIINT